MEKEKIRYLRTVVGELETNSYILYTEGSPECILIDPGAEGNELIHIINEKKLKLKKMVLTHGHIDHCGGVEQMKLEQRVPVVMHRDDIPTLRSYINSDLGRSLGLTPPKTVDEFISDDEIFAVGELNIKVIHTPGHSPGSICLKCGDLLFSGDTIFAGSIGRTDLPGGDFRTINNSIERIKKLPENTVILPGHGDESDLKTELAINPFL